APGFALQSVRSLHHAITLDETSYGRRVHLVGQSVPADRDFELVWSPVVASEVQAAAFAERVGEAAYALVMLTPPEVIAAHATPREVLFIIDTSGSMQGPSIEQAKAALILGVERLAPGDRFNVIRFSSDATSLFDAPEPADDASRALASRFIASLVADGGTEMLGALELALAMPSAEGFLRQIVFITDGAVSNEAELIAMIRAGSGDARLFSVGIGAAPNAYFMREAAAAGRGSYLFISDPSHVRERMQDLFVKLERPALVDLEMQWPNGVSVELAAAMPSDVYAGDPLVVVARLPREARGLLTLSGRGAGGPWVRQLPVAPLGAHTGVAKLWARERIGELTRRKTFRGDPADAEAKVVELALAHHLVSDYTSLVAVDVTPVRPPEVSARPDQAPTSGPVGGAWANTTGFSRTATPASLLALAGMLALLVAGTVAIAPRRTQGLVLR
ncbi:MAG: VWA domain-containing protein, partial [Steroidobacteraceae bacterium]